MSTLILSPAEAWTFARLPAFLAEHDIERWAVTHIGAHHGEEVATYQHCGFQGIRLVEPDPRSLAVLRDKFTGLSNVYIIAAACAAEVGIADLHFAERTVWSGLQPHPTADGETVEVQTLPIRDLLGASNVLVLDTQGSELELLKTANLAQLDLVIIEVTDRRHDTAAYFPDVEAYMTEQGWRLAERWVHDMSGYHDALFVQ